MSENSSWTGLKGTVKLAERPESGTSVRKLLDLPAEDTISGLRNRAILSV